MRAGRAAAWRVSLAPEARRRFESASDSARHTLSSALDAFERQGLRSATSTEAAADGLVCARVGDWAFWVTVEQEERRLVVVTFRAIDPVPRAGAARLAGARAWLNDLGMDARRALRGFRRQPGFAFMSLLVLALGIGGSVAIFATGRTVFLSALPFRDADQLVRLRDHRTAADGSHLPVNMTARNFHAIAEGASTLSGVVAQNGVDLTLTEGEVPERLSGVAVSPGWADVLGLTPVRGRAFTADEERAGVDAGVVLISHGLWQRAFGGAPDILDRDIRLSGRAYRPVGVLPPGVRYPYAADVWIPGDFDRHDGTAHSLNVVGRRAPGTSREAVERELASIAAALAGQFPDTNRGFGFTVEDARRNLVGNDDRIIVALLWSVGFLLLIACLNVATLFVSRLLQRGRELSIRAALGASRSRQLRLLVTESTLLFALGGLLGLAAARLLQGPLSRLIPDVLRDQTALSGFVLDLPAVAVTLGAAAALGLLFGVLALFRTSLPDTAQALRDGGRSGMTTSGRRLQNGLVVLEFGLAVPLMAGGLMLAQHLSRVAGTDLGLDAERVLTMRVGLSGTVYDDGERRSGFVRRLEESLASVPGVDTAGITTVNPLCCGDWGSRIELRDRPPPADGSLLVVHHRLVSPGLHEALGIPLVDGRPFRWSDDASAPPVAIIDQHLADRFWPDENPLGKRLRYISESPDTPWREVVGVAAPAYAEGDYTETWYLPYLQAPTARSSQHLHLMVRAERDLDPASLVDGVRGAVSRVDPTLAVYGVNALTETRSAALRQLRFGSVLAAGLAGFGALLALVGIYGVMSTFLHSTLPELRVRRALGAPAGGIAGSVLVRSLRLVLVGAAIGVVLAIVTVRLFGTWIEGLATLPLGIVLVATLLSVGGGVLATLPLAHRAARVDPVAVLRN